MRTKEIRKTPKMMARVVRNCILIASTEHKSNSFAPSLVQKYKLEAGYGH